MVDRFINFFTSLRLTVVCLAFALILVFVGTLAQVQIGLYEAQAEYFRSFFVYWTPEGSHWKIPVLPGGWLIGLRSEWSDAYGVRPAMARVGATF